jgi:glycosyltransferase involved in cell wall biosynthesis
MQDYKHRIIVEKRLVIISADYPDVISGIGDYAYLLKTHLDDAGIDTCVITTENEKIKNATNTLKINWKLWDIVKVLNTLKEWNAAILIFQYPGILYGRYSLVPHLFIIILRVFGYKIVTTIHEYSNVVLLRRLSEWIFIVCSHRVIVTSTQQRNSLSNYFGVQKKIQVIPIGPNIPALGPRPNHESNIIISFGMFYPNKNMEDVIDFMKSIEQRYGDKYIFRFVGGYHIHFMDYYEKIREKATKTLSNVEWMLNRPHNEVYDFIKDAFLAIQFYNDGASIRRGTLVGIMANGIPMISNKGSSGDELSAIEGNGLFYANTENDVLGYLDKLISDKEYYYKCSMVLQKESINYNFNSIVASYKNILTELSI